MQRIGFLLLLFILAGSVLAQPLSVSITATDNTDCLGRNCFYNGPTILINEVMLSPSSYDGSMVGSAYHTTGGGEWIELYNPHKCDSVDISCYFLGTLSQSFKKRAIPWVVKGCSMHFFITS